MPGGLVTSHHNVPAVKSLHWLGQHTERQPDWLSQVRKALARQNRATEKSSRGRGLGRGAAAAQLLSSTAAGIATLSLKNLNCA